MKYFRIFLSLLIICLMLTGCSFVGPIGEKKDVIFEIPFYKLSLTANESFEKDNEDSNWDLQLTNGNAYISIMAYKYIDLAEDQSPKEIYDWHNEELFSKRDNVSVVKEAVTETEADRTIIKTRYSAENDGSKNYYDSYLLDFKNDEVFAWVLVTGTPSYIESTKELEDIVYTLKIIE